MYDSSSQKSIPSVKENTLKKLVKSQKSFRDFRESFYIESQERILEVQLVQLDHCEGV